MLILFYKNENPEVAYYVTVTQSMLGKLKNTNYSYYVISVFNIKDWCTRLIWLDLYTVPKNVYSCLLPGHRQAESY